MPLTFAGDAVRSAWPLGGGGLTLVQGAVCGLLCALVAPGVLFAPGGCGRPVQTLIRAGPDVDPDTCTKSGL